MATRESEVQALGRSFGHRWSPLLRDLASLDTFPDEVVSLYLDVCWDDEQQRTRARLQIKEQLRQLRARAGDRESAPSVAQDLDRVESFVDDRTHTRGDGSGDRGIALYLCAARGLERMIHSAFRFPNLVVTSPVVALRPLVASPVSATRALCALPDNVRTRLFELSSNGSGLLATIEGDVPRRHSQGGWSQLKLQHYRLEQIAHHHKEAAELIARFVAETPDSEIPRVLVGGRPQEAQRLIAYLPPHIASQLLRVGGVTGSDPEPVAIEAFTRALVESARVEAAERVRAVEEAAGAGGRGCFGAEAVVDALNTGRVMELLLGESFCLGGWRCARCRVVGVGASARCAACSGPTETIELGEAMVHAAVLQDAGVAMLPSPSRLDLHGGVAALLRF